MSEIERFHELILTHRGKQNAILARNIAEELNIERGPSSVNIRKLKTKVADMFKLPIAGNPGLGYYLMDTQEELKETVDSLNKRISNTVNLIVKTMLYYSDFHDLGELELGPEMFGPDEDDE